MSKQPALVCKENENKHLIYVNEIIKIVNLISLKISYETKSL